MSAAGVIWEILELDCRVACRAIYAEPETEAMPRIAPPLLPAWRKSRL
jgi:hypothetical protein